MATYYVNSAGDDSYSGTKETHNDIGTDGPWKTIAKVNSVILNAGDTVKFNCGDVWYEQLVINYSGTTGSPINWGSYVGNTVTTPPLISGFTKLSFLTQIRDGIWQASNPNLNTFIATLNSPTNKGSGYTDNNYVNIALTGGSGTNARANIRVLNGMVTAVIITAPGLGYAVGDNLSAAIPGGSGFSVSIATIGLSIAGTPYKNLNIATLANITTLAEKNQPIGRFPAIGSTTGTWIKKINSLFITVGSSTIFTSYSHGLVIGNIITFSTTGAGYLPSGLATGTPGDPGATYYVIAAGLTANTFQLSSESSIGTSVSTSGLYSGPIIISVSNGTNYNIISSVLLGTFSVTIASPAVFTLMYHGLTTGTPVKLSTSGALPDGLLPDTPYYVISTGRDTFELSDTLGGSAKNTSGSQSGVHSVTITGGTSRGNNTAVTDSITVFPQDGSTGSAVNFTGGEIVIRKQRWILDRGLITAISPGTPITDTIINYTAEVNALGYKPAVGWGYFIQNHLGCLTSFGDWFYDSSTHTFTMYFGSGGPAGNTVKVAQYNSNVVIPLVQSYNTFTGINFEGANQFGITGASGCSNIQIMNCGFNNIGQDAINFVSPKSLIVSGCSITNINNNGITLSFPVGCTLTNNIIDNIHPFAGMGQCGDGCGLGIIIGQPPNSTAGDPALNYNNTITLNRLTNIGYGGISFQGDGILVQGNYVNNYCLIKDDGGGIYTQSTTKWIYTLGRRIFNNIILKGIGTGAGATNSNPSVIGIYCDDGSNDLSVYNNTCACIFGPGIQLHNNDNIDLQNNTIYDAPNLYNPKIKAALSLVSDGNGTTYGLLKNIKIKGNVIWGKIANNLLVMNMNAPNNLLSATGDYNYYHRPIGKDNFFFYKTIWGGGVVSNVLYSKNGWQNLFNIDNNSRDRLPIAARYTYALGANVFTQNFSSPSSILPSTILGNAGALQSCTLEPESGVFDGQSVLVRPSDDTLDAVFYINAGSISSSNQYVLSFSLKGGVTVGAIGVYLDRSSTLDSSLYNYVPISTNRTENTVLFDFNLTVSSQFLAFRIPAGTGPIHLDNIIFSQAIITPPSLNGVMFKHNDSNAIMTIPLTQDYWDARYNYYPAGNLFLQPYTSVILIPATPPVFSA